MNSPNKLRSYQVEPVEWLSQQKRGLLIAPAGSGKTRMSLTALEMKHWPEEEVLWLAPTRELLEQAKASQDSVCPDSRISYHCYAGMPNDLDKYAVIICDECHHLAKSTWGQKIAKVGEDTTIWFLSATPYSDDGDANKFLKTLVVNEHKVPLDQIRDSGGLVPTQVIWLGPEEHDPVLQKTVDREVEYRTEKMVRWVKRVSHSTAKQRATWLVNHKMGIVCCNLRNKILINATESILRIHRSSASILILVNHVSHAEEMIAMAPELLADNLVHGKTPIKERRTKLNEFVIGTRGLIIGTAALFGEGFDAPQMTHVVNAAGGKSPIGVVQRAGRSSRTSEGKSVGIVVDCDDKHLKTLSNHAAERRSIYNSLGYQQS